MKTTFKIGNGECLTKYDLKLLLDSVGNDFLKFEVDDEKNILITQDKLPF